MPSYKSWTAVVAALVAVVLVAAGVGFFVAFERWLHEWDNWLEGD